MAYVGNTYKIIDASSMGSSIDGEAIDVGTLKNWSCHFIWTGTPTGSVSVQSSPNGTNWVTISGSQQTTQGNSGSHLINFSGNGYRYIRPVYTYSSGSGSLTAYITGN